MLQSCYICEELSREGKATTGACMQCNRAGCKQHFHVTWSVWYINIQLRQRHLGSRNAILFLLAVNPVAHCGTVFHIYLRQVNGVSGVIMFLCRVCLFVSASLRSGPVNRWGYMTLASSHIPTLLKCLVLRTPYLASMFPGTVPTWPLKNFLKKGCDGGHVTP